MEQGFLTKTIRLEYIKQKFENCDFRFFDEFFDFRMFLKRGPTVPIETVRGFCEHLVKKTMKNTM